MKKDTALTDVNWDFINWRESRKIYTCEDAANLTGFDFDDCEQAVKVYLYKGNTYIFLQKDGTYDLQIYGNECVSADLEPLERKLFEYYKNEMPQ